MQSRPSARGRGHRRERLCRQPRGEEHFGNGALRDRSEQARPDSNFPARDRSDASAKELASALEKAFVERRVVFAAESREFLQLLALLAVQPGGHFDEQPREEITAIAPIHVRHAFPAQLENLSALGAGWNFQVRFAFQGRDGDFATQSRERERDRHLAIKVVVLALKNWMLLDVDDDIATAARPAANPSFAVSGRA